MPGRSWSFIILAIFSVFHWNRYTCWFSRAVITKYHKLECSPAVPSLTGTRDQFHIRWFFHRPRSGEWFQDDSSTFYFLDTLFVLLLHQLYLRSTGIRSWSLGTSDLNNRNASSHQSGGSKFKIRVLVGLISSEAFFLPHCVLTSLSFVHVYVGYFSLCMCVCMYVFKFPPLIGTPVILDYICLYDFPLSESFL